jgi:hypothetical protein
MIKFSHHASSISEMLFLAHIIPVTSIAGALDALCIGPVVSILRFAEGAARRV